jgi:serine/threonine protein kinase
MPADPTPENLERRLFDEALDLPPGVERDAWLAGACGGDESLELRIQALLRAQAEESQFLPESLPTVITPPAHQPGELIGRYKLLQQIGEGGFGTVWMAEQSEPIKRRVALKIIKLGMDTREVIARFEAERQALAMMDHPNIAKVLDAGATATGRPFFVMELVKGVPVTAFCNDVKLSTRERLELFADVCSAINHAHQKGIIHRDLKPSNILVTLHGDKPVAKVIDFGIAKATQQALTDKTLFTRHGDFIGTPVYMSPEQAALSGIDIDTRSDIYSLGVLLYELLTGKPPFDAKSLLSAGYDEMRRIIREQEPPKPSTRLATATDVERISVAAARHTDPVKLSRLMRGDLDWIVMKAIEKDRGRRYETANAFAADIGRFLNDEPVSASPPGTVYRFRKFARRNRSALRMASLIAALLIGGTITTTLLAVRARSAEKLARERLAEVSRERDQTALARDEAASITRFLQDIFRSPAPSRDGRTITVVEKLDQAARLLDADLSLQPDRRAVLRAALADTYGAIGLPDRGAALQEKVRDHHLAARGPEDQLTLHAVSDLANLYLDAGRLDEALNLATQVEEIRLRILGPDHEDSITAMERLAACHGRAGKPKAALERQEKAYALRIKAGNPQSPGMLSCMINLAILYDSNQRGKEAMEMARKLVPLSESLNGREHPRTLVARHVLAQLMLRENRAEEAIPYWERTVELSKEVNAPDHPDTLKFMMGLAAALQDTGNHEDAVRVSREIVELRRQGSSNSHPETLKAVAALGIALQLADKHEEAYTVLEELEAPARKLYDRESTALTSLLTPLAVACRHTGRMDKAMALMEEIAVATRNATGADSPETLNAENILKSYREAAGSNPNIAPLDPKSVEPGAPGPDAKPRESSANPR